MAKQRATGVPPGGGGRSEMGAMLRAIREQTSVLSKILQRLDRQREEQGRATRMQQSKAATGGDGGSSGGRGGGGGQDGGGGDGGEPRQGLRSTAFTAAATGIGGAVSALFMPQVTEREREHAALRGASTEAASQVAMGIARSTGASEAMQMSIGAAASNVAGAAVDSEFHRVLTQTQQARGGFADLEQMAAAGIDISDEMVAQRAVTTYQQANRAYDFRDRREAALNEVNRGDFEQARDRGTEGIQEAMNRFKEELSGMTSELSRARGTLSNDNSDAYRSVNGGG